MNGTTETYEFDRIKAPYVQLFIILLGAFMAVLDTSVVNVAIPKMETELNANTDQIQWVLTGYMLVSGMLIPVSGWLTDKFGAKRLFLFSLITFTIGSALCGLAWNLDTEIIFRIVQAAGGGFMMPVALSMIYRIFPPERRGFVMGLFGVVIMVAPALGPAISGYFVQYASWRLVFYINIPIGIVATIFSIILLHDFPHQSEGKLDIWGFVLSLVGFFLLLYGINEVPSRGWTSVTVVVCLALGAVCLIMLIAVELMVKNPVMELRAFKNYMFSMSILISSIIYIALFVGVFLLPVYLQDLMGYTALRTGLFMTPAALASAVMMLVGGLLLNKIGARVIGIVGLLVMAGASYGFSWLDLNSTSGYIQFMYIARSLGMGMVMMPITTIGMNALPMKLISQGSALSNAARNIAASLGTAALTSYMTTHERQSVAQLSNAVTPSSPQGMQIPALQATLQHGAGSAVAAHNEALMLIDGWIQKAGFVNGIDATFFISTLLVLVALVATFFFVDKRKKTTVMQNSTSPSAHAALADS